MRTDGLLRIVVAGVGAGAGAGAGDETLTLAIAAVRSAVGCAVGVGCVDVVAAMMAMFVDGDSATRS
jgi:hypothetical protein